MGGQKVSGRSMQAAWHDDFSLPKTFLELCYPTYTESMDTLCISIADQERNIPFYHIYPTPPLGQDMTQGQFFKRSLTGLNSEFSFS